MDVVDARRARTTAYVAFTRAAGDAVDAAHKHGQGSPQHVAAQAKVTPLREAFSEAADAYRAAEAQAELAAQGVVIRGFERVDDGLEARGFELKKHRTVQFGLFDGQAGEEDS